MPSVGRTLYDLLGVARGASADMIASAYQARLADLESSGASEATIAVREAYHVLSNAERRRKYDGRLAAVPAPTPDPVLHEFDSRKPAILGVLALVVVAGALGWKLKPEAAAPVEVPAVVAPRAAEPEKTVAQEEEEQPQVEAANAPAESRSAPPLITPPVLAGKEIPPHEISGRYWISMMRITLADANGRFLRQATGVFIDRDSIITNCHVLKDAHRITVRDSTERQAMLTIADEELDLCKLRVTNMQWGRGLTLAPLADLRAGQRVYAMGAPWETEGAISEGIVNSLHDDGNGVLIQVSTPVPPTWDGGGLFTADGRLAGILTRRHAFGKDFNAAVPVDWIANMRPRKAANRDMSTTPQDVAAALIGRWQCKEPWGKRDGLYEYRADGTMKIVYDEGSVLNNAPYKMDGMTVLLWSRGDEYRLQIESIGTGRMVQYFDSGRRLACQKAY